MIKIVHLIEAGQGAEKEEFLEGDCVKFSTLNGQQYCGKIIDIVPHGFYIERADRSWVEYFKAEKIDVMEES